MRGQSGIPNRVVSTSPWSFHASPAASPPLCSVPDATPAPPCRYPAVGAPRPSDVFVGLQSSRPPTRCSCHAIRASPPPGPHPPTQPQQLAATQSQHQQEDIAGQERICVLVSRLKELADLLRRTRVVGLARPGDRHPHQPRERPGDPAFPACAALRALRRIVHAWRTVRTLVTRG